MRCLCCLLVSRSCVHYWLYNSDDILTVVTIRYNVSANPSENTYHTPTFSVLPHSFVKLQ